MAGFPVCERYAHVKLPDGGSRVAGYTEASRGCKHLCRHCPIVPVYGGRFFVVQPDVVLEDIARQVAAGAEHITFGDPDFFNGPTHAMRIVAELHRRFPRSHLRRDIKVEHLLQHAGHLPTLRDTGCLFVTSAVEAVDDRILEIFDKRHTREDFVRAVSLCREVESAPGITWTVSGRRTSEASRKASTSRPATATATARTPRARRPATNGVPASVDGAATSARSRASRRPRRSRCTRSAGRVRRHRRDDGCATGDLLAAIDAAVFDGVDVINYSIGGGAAITTVSLTDQAFLRAAAARHLRGGLRRQLRTGRLHGRQRRAVDHDGRGIHDPEL